MSLAKTPITALPLLALAFATPALAQVQDFRLPPSPTPTASPNVQGPVDDSQTVPVAPRVIPTARPTPTATATPPPRPTPTPTAAPQPTPSPTTGASPATPTVNPARPRPTGTNAPAGRQQEPTPQPQVQAPVEGANGTPVEPLPFPMSASGAAPPSPAAPISTDTSTAEPDGGETPGWLVALLAILAAAAAGFFYWRRSLRKTAPPRIAPSALAVGNATAPAALPALADLRVEVEPVRVSRSVMNSSLSYRLILVNRGTCRALQPDRQWRSHERARRVPLDQQMADPSAELPELHRLDYLGPGQRKALSGEIRLPLQQVRPILQGKTPMLVPLVRLLVSNDSADPRAFTFVVGKQAQMAGARLQPFRLDTPPQSYSQIGARALG